MADTLARIAFQYGWDLASLAWRRSPNAIARLTLATFCLVALTATVPGQPLAGANDPVGFISSAVGDVKICRHSSVQGKDVGCRQAKPGETVYENTIIRTGERGRARIAYADEERGDPEYISIREDDGAFVRYKREEDGRFSKVYIGTSTTMSVHRVLKKREEFRKQDEKLVRETYQREWDQSTWNPFAGKRSAIWLMMRRSATMSRFMKWITNNEAFKVRTGTSVCGGRGTDYVYQRDPQTGEQMVAVLDGSVACAPSGQPETEIAPGTKLVVSKQGSQQSPLSDKEAANIREKSEFPDNADTLSDDDWLENSKTIILAGIEEAFARAEAEIRRVQPKLEAEQKACVAAVKSYWAGRSDAEGKRLKARLDEADRSFVANEVQDVAAKARDLQQKLQELLSIVRRTGEKASGASEDACIAAKASQPDADKSHAQALRARNLFRLASEARGRTMDQLRTEIDAIRPDKALPDKLKQRLEKLQESLRRKEREKPICNLPNPSPHRWAASERNGWALKRAADKELQEAVSFLWSAKEAIGETNYRRLYGRERAARHALDPSRWYLCHLIHNSTRQTCRKTALRAGVKNRGGALGAEGRKHVVNDIISRRQEWANKLGAMADEIDARLEAARKDAAKAASCTRETKAAPETVVNVCSKAQSYYRTGRKHYENGDAAAYRSSLLQAKAALGDAPEDACGGLASKIAKGKEQADVLKEINAEAGPLLASCKGDNPRARAARMRKLSNLLANSSQPHLQKLKRRLEAAQRVAVAYADTKDAFRNADLKRAERVLSGAQAALGSIESQDCADLRSALAKAPKVLTHWRNKLAAVERFSDACDISAMRSYRSRLEKTDSPIAATLAASLNMALTDCENRKPICPAGHNVGKKLANGKTYCIPTQATADAKCKKTNGGRDYRAVDFKLNGTFECIPTKAAANAWCDQNNPGTGWYAVNIKADGTYGCMPSKATANANCRKANPGLKGIYASINSEGGYTCKQNKKAAAAKARADGHRACQRANKDRRARAGRYLGNGQWSCYIPGQNRNVAKPPRRRIRQRTVPRIRMPTAVPVNPRL